MKLYILARKDAPIGKVMAHVGHVCCLMMRRYNDISVDIVTHYKYLEDFDKEYHKKIDSWIRHYHQTKIILEVKNEEDLEKFRNYVECKAPSFSIHDIHTKEMYCFCIGPIDDDKAIELGLKKLRLFK